MTCHNQKEQTLSCLKALFAQNSPKDLQLDVYLVDDGSTDGTSLAIRDLYPRVNVLAGDGSLFWCGGMRWAFASALKAPYDFYLWLNSDTELFPDCIQRLFETRNTLADKGHVRTIIVGSTQDGATGKHTYGGMKRSSFWHPFRYELVKPPDGPVRVDNMNGNCVLIPSDVAERVGNFDPHFSMTFGDFDYGLRARNEGCSVWLCPGYAGACSRNTHEGTWLDKTLPFKVRWAKVREPKGLPPKEWLVYTRRHGGGMWPVFFLSPYANVVLSSFCRMFNRRGP